MSDLEVLRRLAVFSAASAAELDAARGARDYSEDDQHETHRTAPPTRAKLDNSALRALSSNIALQAIISFEVSSEADYRRRYEHPIAPGGDSGITVGIGYDLGYNTVNSVRRDFGGLLSGDVVETLCKACGLKGNEARLRLSEFRAVSVPWDVARDVFQRVTIPKCAQQVIDTFPNAIELKGHAFGALLSLVYNRGTSLSGPRRTEMLEIKNLMQIRAFAQVPAQIRAMKRLWENDPAVRGVVKRRLAEATMFESGLEEMVRGNHAPVDGEKFESRTSQLHVAALEGDGQFYEEIPDSGEFRENAPWNKVTWASDEQSPDYKHLLDRSLTGTTFEFGAPEMELLLAANSFSPTRDHGRIIFALRGAELVTSLVMPGTVERQEGRTRLTLRDKRPDHQNFRCVIGVYDVDRQLLSAYSASTVPNRKAIVSYISNGERSNMMTAGCYGFEVGWHQPSNEHKKIPGCLVENGRITRQKCVLRSKNNYHFDVEDEWDNASLAGDNLHPGKSEVSARFSSWGCLVVSGSVEPLSGGERANVAHTGEWERFRAALGLPAWGIGGHGNEYGVVLLTGLEAAIAADLVRRKVSADDVEIERKLRRLRQGSRGAAVARLQTALGLVPSGVFDHATTKEFTNKQRQSLGWADGIYSAAMAKQLKLDALTPVSAEQRRFETVGERPNTGVWVDKQARLDALYYEIGLYHETARGRSAGAEELNLERLSTTQLEFGFAALKSVGASIAQSFERQLHDYLCGKDITNHFADRSDLRARVDSAVKTGTDTAREALVSVLVLTVASVVPRRLLEKVVDLVMEKLVQPVLGGSGAAALQQMDGGIAWLCQRWSSRLDVPAAAPNTQQPNATDIPVPIVKSRASLASAGPAIAASTYGHLLTQIENCAASVPPDTAGLQRYLTELRTYLATSGAALTKDEHERLLDVICAPSLFLDRGPEGDVFAVISDIETAVADHRSGKKPIVEAELSSQVRKLHGNLANAHTQLREEHITRTLEALKQMKRFDDLAVIADRFITRDSKVLGLAAAPYAQGLIDGGRIVAGLEVLHGALDNAALTATQLGEVNGLIGRGHKQIYVNHVRSPGDAAAFGDRLTDQLRQSIAAYRRTYDPSRPGDNTYQGVNFIALLKRAELDRVKVDVNVRADDLARAMIREVEPKMIAAPDHWAYATLGEAYLTLGDHENAARWYGAYANHPKIDGFSLNSTVRQLEEVWRLKAASSGAGAILTGLKASLAKAENGQLRLDAAERRALSNIDSIEFQQFFETKTAGGKQIRLADLQMICRCGHAVAAIQTATTKSADTIGTGFLFNAADLGVDLAPDKSFLLTNAHVIWDPERGQGQENGALLPTAARIILETDHLDGRTEVYSARHVVWQSPSSLHDATLVELDRRVGHVKPLSLAPPDLKLSPDLDGSGKASRLAVIGHPEGGPLSIGVSGSLDEMQATLLDMGGKADTQAPVFLHYKTPTEPGNSGSPVFDADRWQVVGLHHAGFDEKLGRPRLGGKAGRHFANEGIHIDSIRAAVRVQLNGRPKKRKGLFWRS